MSEKKRNTPLASSCFSLSAPCKEKRCLFRIKAGLSKSGARRSVAKKAAAVREEARKKPEANKYSGFGIFIH